MVLMALAPTFAKCITAPDFVAIPTMVDAIMGTDPEPRMVLRSVSMVMALR